MMFRDSVGTAGRAREAWHGDDLSRALVRGASDRVCMRMSLR